MFYISKEELQKLLNYLVKKPYIEVIELINMLSTLKVSEDKDELQS